MSPVQDMSMVTLCITAPPYVKTRLSPAPCFAPSCPSIGLVSHTRTFLFHSTNCFQYLISTVDRKGQSGLQDYLWAWVIYTVWKMQLKLLKLASLATCLIVYACQGLLDGLVCTPQGRRKQSVDGQAQLDVGVEDLRQ